LRRLSPVCETCRPAPKTADRRDQRPCSTNETVIRSVVSAAMSTLTFSMRFCFAPTSSSPS
jgi:hypothetical protein